MENSIREQINAVVEAREKSQQAAELRTSAYNKWVEEYSPLLDDEAVAKSLCQEAEGKLRELALEVYAGTGDKAVAPGVGIRVMTRLNYEGKESNKTKAQ